MTANEMSAYRNADRVVRSSCALLARYCEDANRPGRAAAYSGRENDDQPEVAAVADLLSVLLAAEVCVAELCHGQDPANQCWVTLREVRAALAKAGCL